MVYLKQLLHAKASTSLLLACLVLGAIISESESTKIVYKKSIDGKANVIRTKARISKTIDYDEPTLKPTTPTTTPTTIATPITTSTTTSTTTTTTTTPTPQTPTTETPSSDEHLEVAESAPAMQKIKLNELNEKPEEESSATQEPKELEATISAEDDTATDPTIDVEKDFHPILDLPENHIEMEHVDQDTIVVEHPPLEQPETSSNEESSETKTSTESAPTTPDNKPTPCTCGVFMTSQVKRSKNPYETPKGSPVITNELDRIFPCTAVGQKQCQTKCLEAIIQHLPNSANILCATLDRDIRKERAYLYIKNCRNQWYNTNLTAGREYCCKNGEPYQCPLV